MTDCGDEVAVWFRNRFTGETVAQLDERYALKFGARMSTPSEAALTFDTACCPDNPPTRFRDELVVSDPDDDGNVFWVGPVTDTTSGGPNRTVKAEDRSYWAYRARLWKTAGTLRADAADLIVRMFEEADLYDPSGISTYEVLATGLEFDIAWPKDEWIGVDLDRYSPAAPWTVVGDTCHIGFLETDSGHNLLPEYFEGEPTPVEAGTELVGRACVKTSTGNIFCYPETPEVKPDTIGGLVERFYENSVTDDSGPALARRLVERNQHGLYIEGGAITSEWPIPWTDLRPGLLFGVDGGDLGACLESGDVVQMSTVDVDVVDGSVNAVKVGFNPEFVD